MKKSKLIEEIDRDCQCLAADPHRPQRIYCGTFDAGLWCSDDAGISWLPVEGMWAHKAVMSVAVSPLEEQNGVGVVWAGTEPSALFRSEDGGHTWEEKTGLQSLPAKSTWRFPPRPWTHHVRWIEPDAIPGKIENPNPNMTATLYAPMRWLPMYYMKLQGVALQKVTTAAPPGSGMTTIANITTWGAWLQIRLIRTR